MRHISTGVVGFFKVFAGQNKGIISTALLSYPTLLLKPNERPTISKYLCPAKSFAMEYIQPATMPAPKGHYSPAVVHGGLVFVSGQLPVDDAGQVLGNTVQEQTQQCLQKIAEILAAANSRLDLILKVNIYLSDVALWPRVNAAYADFMGKYRPARVIIPCGLLHYGCLVEIDCVAAVAQ